MYFEIFMLDIAAFALYPLSLSCSCSCNCHLGQEHIWNIVPILYEVSCFSCGEHEPI